MNQPNLSLIGKTGAPDYQHQDGKSEARNPRLHPLQQPGTHSPRFTRQANPLVIGVRISFGFRPSDFGFWSSMRALGLVLFSILAFFLCSSTTTLAIVPEPDNILYGSVTLDNVPVTAAMTNVVIEARRTTNGPAIASYRMGSDQQVGNFYALKLSIESVVPINDANSSQAGDSLFIVLRDNSGVRGQTNFTVVERGAAQRFDFGLSVIDIDGDGLPDGWEFRYFGNLSKTPGSITTNGQTVVQHFIAGTDPNNPNGGFRLYIDKSNDLKHVWFTAARAEGPGYDGMTRLYTLQYRPVLESGFWANVPGYISITGSNQTVNYYPPELGDVGFYRACITLLGFNLSTGGSGPPLAITLISPTSARVSWPSPSTGFVLQENADLSTANWVYSTATVSDDGTIRFIIISPPSGSRFYRLITSQ